MNDQIKKASRKLFIGYAVCLILAGAVCGLFNPLYVSLSTDIAYSTSILPLLLTIGSKLCEALFTGVLLGLAAVGEYLLFGGGSALTVNRVLAVGFALLFRILNFTVDGLINGFRDFVFGDVIDFAVVAIIDAGIVVFAILFSRARIGEIKSREAALAKAARIAGVENPVTPLFPAKGLFHKANPVVKACLIGSAVSYSLSALSDLFYDIGLGWPQSLSEWGEVGIHYLSTALLWFLCYLASRLTVEIVTKDSNRG